MPPLQLPSQPLQLPTDHADCVTVPLGDLLPKSDCVEFGDADTDDVARPEALGAVDADGEPDELSLSVERGLADGEIVPVVVAVVVLETVDEPVKVTLAVAEALADAEREPVGVAVPRPRLPEPVGENVLLAVALAVPVELYVGDGDDVDVRFTVVVIEPEPVVLDETEGERVYDGDGDALAEPVLVPEPDHVEKLTPTPPDGLPVDVELIVIDADTVPLTDTRDVADCKAFEPVAAAEMLLCAENVAFDDVDAESVIAADGVTLIVALVVADGERVAVAVAVDVALDVALAVELVVLVAVADADAVLRGGGGEGCVPMRTRRVARSGRPAPPRTLTRSTSRLPCSSNLP